MKKILVIINDIDPNIYLAGINKHKFSCVILYQKPVSLAMEVKFRLSMEKLNYFEWVFAESKDDLLPKAKKLATSTPFDMIITYAEDLIIPVERLKMEIGLFNQYEITKDITNKFYQREKINEYCPELSGYYFEINTPQDLKKIPNDLKYPGILKPISMAGSKGVVRIPNFESLKFHVEKLESEKTLSSGFVFEELFVGSNWYESLNTFDDYVSVESIVSNGSINHLTVSGKPIIAKPFRETGLVMPSLLPQNKQQILFDAATKIIKALGYRNGPTHIELKLTKTGPKLIEFNPRAGGPVPYMIQISSDYEIINNIFNSYLGYEIDPFIKFDNAAAFFSFQIGNEKEMKIMHINDNLDMSTFSDVKEFFVFKHRNDIVDPNQGTQAMVAFAYLIQKSPENCIALKEIIENLLEVKYIEI